jgi:1-acyl-sn-glycerol-3-phosphate acyltransferase
MKRPASRTSRALIIGLYILLFWLVLPALLILAAGYCDARLGLRFGALKLRLLLGLPPAFLFVPMFVRSLVDFRRHGLEWPISALPADDIVQRGLYTYWRHPIYLFFTLSVAALGLLAGSGGMLLIVLPAFALIEVGYALNEERILIRRFGARYERYRRRTPLVVPRLATLLRPLFAGLGRLLFGLEVQGREHLPAGPPFFVVAAHRSYLDAFFAAWAVRFPACFIATYEMFRSPLRRFIFGRFLCIPKRRYRPDARTGREIVRRLEPGFAIGVFPEGERSWTGATSAWKPEVVALLQRYPDIPIVPVRLDGNYLGWPRWAKGPRRAKITATILPPFRISPGLSAADVERELRSRVEPDDRGRTVRSRPDARGIAKVLYRCPDCRSFQGLGTADRDRWTCSACALNIRLRPDYSVCCVRGGRETVTSLAALYDRLRIGPADFVRDGGAEEYAIAEAPQAALAEERNGRLVSVASGRLRLTSRNLQIGEYQSLRLKNVRSVTTESNRRLQIYEGGEGRLLEIRFTGESVLKWQDYLIEVIKHEYRRVPNHR